MISPDSISHKQTPILWELSPVTWWKKAPFKYTHEIQKQLTIDELCLAPLPLLETNMPHSHFGELDAKQNCGFVRWKDWNAVAMKSEPVGQPETNMVYSVTVGKIRMREQDFQVKAWVTSLDVTNTEESARVLER